mgnify:CR=1 FL=1
MKFNRKFEYPTSTRALIDGKRHYNITGQKLPSVTTILSATQSDEKKQSLANWRNRMGAQYADKIRDVSAMRGTAMHKYLECYIDGTGHKDLTSIGKEAEPMARGPGRDMGSRGDAVLSGPICRGHGHCRSLWRK